MIRRAMILAAGFGTRLRPLTNSVAKPMVRVCNRPLIGWAIESLLASGINEIVVNLHHAPEGLEKWVPEAVGLRGEVHFTREHEILGTGGGIRNARELLEGRGAFAVMNGDTIQQPPIEELDLRRKDEDSLAALLLRVPPRDDRFTPVYLDRGHVTGFGEGTGEPLMFAGCHVISDRIFDRLPDRAFSGIVEHAYMPALAANDATIAGVVSDGMWFDVGTPRRLFDASMSLLEMIADHNVGVPDGSRLESGSLTASDADGEVERSVIGAGCGIASGARVRRSVLLDAVQLAEGADVCGSIIGPGVRLDGGIYVENAFLCINDGESAGGTEFFDGSLVARPIDESRPMMVG